ncbi:MAG: hypothetical protein MJZ22_03015 [Candidatus Saccharibacteria bacterium]|nr:hypothetical protein [Candidatus Saccharibacteria bacterium]
MPKQTLVFESAVQLSLKNGMIRTQKAQKFGPKAFKPNAAETNLFVFIAEA